MIRRTIKSKRPAPPRIRGGQGRSAGDLEADASYLGCLVFVVVAAILIIYVGGLV